MPLDLFSVIQTRTWNGVCSTEQSQSCALYLSSSIFATNVCLFNCLLCFLSVSISFLVSFIFLLTFSNIRLQLPEPLILFRYYNDFIGLAKESQSIIMEELEALRVSPTPVTPAQVSVELNRVLFKIRDLLRQLPPAHYKTLQFLIEHLHRYVDLWLHY